MISELRQAIKAGEILLKESLELKKANIDASLALNINGWVENLNTLFECDKEKVAEILNLDDVVKIEELLQK